MYILECEECKFQISENNPEHQDWICVHPVSVHLDDDAPALLFCSANCAVEYISVEGVK